MAKLKANPFTAGIKELRVKVTVEQEILIRGMYASGEFRSISDAARDVVARGLLEHGFGAREQGLV